ncbi:hypothetical protein [Curtobacterium sp. MCBD17_040]|uniref:hypothetical protein n=1 Tax=Curtobacterium sp. MCBD17_040 TaxID=2175674 RepID=UPI000DA9DA12|nr:hypothetical protein [Curtobacterium sp. MCBD17_040]WIB65904.1 hypothetical protein DEI94_17465 [Curtobacterium sp. MCBD17_040]
MRRLIRQDRAATDPVLVIAAIAVSLVLLVGGSFAVAGLIGNGRDLNARKDLANLAVAETDLQIGSGLYTADVSQLTAGDTNVTFSGNTPAPTVVSDGASYAAFATSTTGRTFYIDSVNQKPTLVSTPWPTTAPAGYPDGCWWPKTSTALTASSVTNLVQDPVAATAPDGSTATLGLSFNSHVYSAPVPLTSGTAFRVVPAGNGSSDTAMTFGDQAANAMRLGMQAGHTYTVSGTVYLPQAQQSTSLQAGRARSIAVFASGTGGYEKDAPEAPNTSGAHRVSITFTIPSDATQSFIRLYDGSSDPADVVYWTNLTLTDGSADRTFADGSSPGWVWNGTSNQSTSTGPALG